MLGAGLGGYGGYASPEGLADAHGMGYGDVEGGGVWGGPGGRGAHYSALTRALIDAYARLYGGNHSLLGKDRSVFGGPMLTSGPTDIQGSVPTDANPGGFIGSGIGLDHTFPAVGHVTSNPTPAFVDLTDPNLLDPMGGGVGATPAGGYRFGGGVATDANPMGDIDGGGGGCPWWDPECRSKNTGGEYYGMINPETGIWNDWDRPKDFVTHVRPSVGGPSPWAGMLSAVAPYVRKKHPLAYENAYNMWEGGDDM